MGYYCCEIERCSNGYEVELVDPKIVEANRKAKSIYKDPHCCYVFKTIDEVLAFLGKNLDAALPADDYESSFDAAVAEDDGDE